jgi:hypothetical protein
MVVMSAGSAGSFNTTSGPEPCEVFPLSFDLDGDQAPESILYEGEWPDVSLRVMSADAGKAWFWQLSRGEVCPSCAQEWYWFLVTFADLDAVTEGPEALFQWYDYASDTGGVTVVSPRENRILANVQGAALHPAAGELGARDQVVRMVQYARMADSVLCQLP